MNDYSLFDRLITLVCIAYLTCILASLFCNCITIAIIETLVLAAILLGFGWIFAMKHAFNKD